jgi:hypothetical protein
VSDRPQLAPVAGLKRTETLPSPPPRRQASPVRAVEPALSAAAEPASTPAAQPKPDRSASAAHRPSRVSDTADVMRAISVSLPVSLAQTVKAHAKSHGTSYADLLMDSVLAQRAQLSELVSRRRRDRPRDELFVRSVPRAGEEPFVSLSLRLLAPNVAALDSLVAEHNASSRSELCAAALRAHLAGP